MVAYQESSQLNSCLLQKEGVIQNAQISPQEVVGWASRCFLSRKPSPAQLQKKESSGLKGREKNKGLSVQGGFAS